MTRATRIILTIALLAVGVEVAFLLVPSVDFKDACVAGAALALALIPEVNQWLFTALQRLRRVTPRARAITTAAVFVVAFAYLTFTAHHQHRSLYPKYHDNQSYAVEAQIIASGHLWLPTHAYPEFFDTFHVLVEPVYASMYFPGAAIMFAIGVLAGWPWWVVPILVAAGCVALTYRVLAEIIDGFAGLLGAFWLVALIDFRHLSAMLMSHPPVLLLGLATIWAYLRWRRRPSVRWLLLVGAFAGFAAITRPVDAFCYAAPVGVAILLDLRHQRFAQLVRAAALIVLGAAPFLALQLFFNHGVSGSWLTSPYRVYLDRDAPQFSFGFHTYDPSLKPKSTIVQKQIYHTTFNREKIQAHRPDMLLKTWFGGNDARLPVILDSTTPSLLLVPLLVVGLLGVGTTRVRWVLVAVLPLYCFGYLFYAALMRHYTPVVAPPIIALGMLGIRQAEALWPAARRYVLVFCAALVAGHCVMVLPELNRLQEDDPWFYPEMIDARVTFPNNPHVVRPALIFVRFTPGQNVHSEPVYNWEAADIDDNPIIYAHDLGPHNIDLVRYYAQRQPNRRVFYYDRATAGTLVGRGTVVDELRRLTRLRASDATSRPPATMSTTRRSPTSRAAGL